MAYTQSPINFGVGTGSSPLNKKVVPPGKLGVKPPKSKTTSNIESVLPKEEKDRETTASSANIANVGGSSTPSSATVEKAIEREKGAGEGPKGRGPSITGFLRP